MQQTYEQLAERYERQQEPRQRDNLLVLAADAAFNGGQAAEAERLRRRLLELNPHHLLRPFASFAEAVESPDVRDLLADLRRQYPPEYVERLLGKMERNMAPSASATPPVSGNGPRVSSPPRSGAKPPSPYERYEPPPPAREPEAWNHVIAQSLFWLALVSAAALAVYVLGGPFLW
jgi:hypothetical protein